MATRFASMAEMADGRRTMAHSISCHTGWRDIWPFSNSRIGLQACAFNKHGRRYWHRRASRPFPLYPAFAAPSRDYEPNEALDRVIALYWKPVYRFIRIKFHKNN